ncbi:MAG: hypothetical protein KZQ96_17105 [Candidatus Thiodiazotropha sp. (ex Lucinoma borealis)]|nr:hypothetical protein [Candidatus Thiodiazotropha sp. (ex Lucinoma borealis)]MCU7868562.1 hypothetical protein [Candidatus Thiodiazotropha sp. (ex Lucinoma borealis)]
MKINRPSGTRIHIQNLIELTVDVVDNQLEIQADAPEGIDIKNHEFDGYTSIDTKPPRYSLNITHPDRENQHTELNFLGDLLGKVIQELEENPEATITIKTAVSK